MTAWEVLRDVASPATADPTHERFVNCDGEKLRDLASAHGLLPAVADGLDDETTVSDAEMALGDRRRRQAGASLHLVSELGDVLECLADAGVAAIAYKGPVLATVAHGDVGARQYGDVDLFVGQSSFGAARDALEDRGLDQIERLRALGEVALRNDAGAVVDLHAHLLPCYHPATLSFDDAWERRRSVEVAGTAVPALAPADRLVVLSVHGTKHAWYRLGWVRDVATVLAADHADPETVLDRATALRCRRHVLLACWLAGRALSVELPPAIERAVDGDSTVRELGERCLESLRSGDVRPPEDGEQFAIQYRALERRADRLRFGARVATIPSEADLASVRLPGALSPLYRAVRPARLATRYGRRALGRDGRREETADRKR